MKKIILVSFIITLSLISVAAGSDEYFTLEGPNCYVHFPKGYGDLASKLITQAEPIMTTLSAQLNTKINGKSHFVIEDKIDLPNAYTTNSIYPLIAFFPVFPDDVLLGGIGPNVTDWFDTLLWHEGTHLYNMEMMDPISSIATRIFGRFPLFYPILSSPLANLEGLAVFNETKFQRVGRGSDAIYPMILDAAIDANNLPEPKLILGNYDLDSYDLAGFPYIYGWSFMEFLAQNYGENAPKKLQDQLIKGKDRLFIPKYDSALRDLTKKSYSVLTHEWYNWLKENYDLPPLSPEGTLLQNSGQTVYPGFFKGDYFYYAQSGQVSPGIYRINLITNKEELVTFVPNIYGNITEDSMGTIYYTKLDSDSKGNSYFNIYSYNSGSNKPLITGERAYCPQSFDGETLYYLRHISGQGNALYKKVGESDPELIYKSALGEEILHFTATNNGEFYVSMWREGGFVDLAQLTNGGINYLTNDSFSDTNPVLSEDETNLFFQSNRDNHYGIWVLDLMTGQIAPVVTNHYGAFKPVLNKSDSKELGFISYTDQGLRIGIYEWTENASWISLAQEEVPKKTKYPTLSELLLNNDQYTIRRYSGASWLKPTFWMPSIIGASLLGSDPLQNYIYTFGYNVNPFEELELPTHELFTTVDFYLNPLHSISLALQTNMKDFELVSAYSGRVPLGKDSLLFQASGNTNGDLSGSVAYSIPWGFKHINGTNYLFTSLFYNLGFTDVSTTHLRYGAGTNLKLHRNLYFNLELALNHHTYGFSSPGSTNLGCNVAVINSGIDWIFARPMWVFGASSTMLSEKMTFSPKTSFILGDKDWDLSVGAELTNTLNLMYGSTALTFGVDVVYYPKVDKIVFGPVISY